MENKIKEAIESELLKENIKVEKVYEGVEDGEKTLFIVIDSENIVDSNLCVKAMKIVNPILEKIDIDLDDYVIDVCSKGVEE
jgi:ribosome maturation factor RimP